MVKIFLLYFFVSISILANGQSTDYSQAIALGEVAAANNQYPQAIKYFSQAIELKPSAPEAYLKQMECAVQKRDLSTFKRSLLQLEGLEYPIILEIYLTYAQLAKKQRLYNDGLLMLTKAETKYPKNKNIFLHRAELYQKLNNNAELIKALQDAASIDPSDLQITHQLAVVYMDINSAKSIEIFKQLLKQGSYRDSALSSLGLLSYKSYKSNPKENKKDLFLALEYYLEYQKGHPNDVDTKNVIKNIRILLE